MFLVLAGICLLLSVILSLLTYYCSYKYKGWRGVVVLWSEVFIER